MRYTAVKNEHTIPIINVVANPRIGPVPNTYRHAVANGLPVVAVNRVGFEPDPSGRTKGIHFWGTSFVAGPQGEIYYEASNVEEESIIVGVDIDHSEDVRRWWPFLRDRRIEEYGDITRRFID